MAYFRLADHEARKAPMKAPKMLANGPALVQIVDFHEALYGVAMVGDKGIEEMRLVDNEAAALKLAHDVVVLGMAKFGGRFEAKAFV